MVYSLTHHPRGGTNPCPLKVFLCHATADKPAVRKLYRYLRSKGMEPWLDAENLLPGENWEVEIPNAIFDSDAILVCLSKNSVNKEGYVQKEITFALDKALEKPEGMIFVIPAKLEECDVPQRLNRFQWVDLYREDGCRRLMLSLNKRAAQLGPAVEQAVVADESVSRIGNPTTKMKNWPLKKQNVKMPGRLRVRKRNVMLQRKPLA